MGHFPVQKNKFKNKTLGHLSGTKRPYDAEHFWRENVFCAALKSGKRRCARS